MGEAPVFTHREYQEAVKAILNHYGFITMLEYWSSAGRLDVFGRCVREEVCGNATVAVEVSRTSRLERDVARVYGSGATYGFVLAVKPVELPPLEWGNVFVVRGLEEFENRLREVLGIAEALPKRLPGLVSGVQPPRYPDLDEAFRAFGVPEELRRRARRLLLHAYTVSYELYADDETSPTGHRVVGDEAAYLILHQLGLVDLERHSRQRAYIVRVLDRKLAEVEAEKHVEGVEEALRRLVEGCGWEAGFIAACTGNLSDYDKPEPRLLKCMNIPYRVTAAIGALVPVIWERYNTFWRGLEELDLAFYIYVCRTCRRLDLLPGARGAIMELVNDSVVEFSKNEDLVKELASLNVLYSFFPLNTWRCSTLLSELNALGLKLEDLEAVSYNFYRRGLVSRFVRDRPPYLVVYDIDGFRKAIVDEIASLYTSRSRK